MKRAMGKYLEKFSRKVDLVAKMLYASPIENRLIAENRMIAWRDANGDKTLRLHYDLYQRSVVFDVGGYEGKRCRLLETKSDAISVWPPRSTIMSP